MASACSNGDTRRNQRVLLHPTQMLTVPCFTRPVQLPLHTICLFLVTIAHIAGSWNSFGPWGPEGGPPPAFLADAEPGLDQHLSFCYFTPLNPKNILQKCISADLTSPPTATLTTGCHTNRSIFFSRLLSWYTEVTVFIVQFFFRYSAGGFLWGVEKMETRYKFLGSCFISL